MACSTGAAVLLAAAILFCSRGEWAAAALVGVGAATAALALEAPEAALAWWIAASPWASYVLRYPAERSVVTFDRVAVPAIAIGLVWRAWRREGRLPAPRLCEVAWAGYAAVGFVSVAALSSDKGYALRTAVDALALPLALFYAVRVGFDRVRGRRDLFWGAVALAVALPWPGLVEFATGVDLMPFKGGSIFRSGVVRPNGPFANDVAYSILAAVLAVLLTHAPRALGLEVRGAARLVWRAGVAAALLAAMLPLFRTVMFAAAAALALPWVLAGRVRSLARVSVVALLVALAASPLVALAARTHTFQDRITDPSSVYSRLATLRAGIEIVGDHPLAGVGLANYRAYFDRKFGTAWYVSVDEVAGVGAENSPHNDLLGVWAELGVAGVFFYLLAALGAAAAAWRRRNTAALALLVVYAVPGATLYHGVYSEPNLLFLCALGVAFRVGEQGERR